MLETDEDKLFWRERIFELDKLDGEAKEHRDAEIKSLMRDATKTFGTPHGQRILMALVETCYLFTPYGQQSARAYAMEGRREVILWIFALLGLSPDPASLIKLVRTMASANATKGE